MVRPSKANEKVAFFGILLLLFIWGNSFLTGLDSYNLTKFIFGELPDEVRIAVRKTAHLVEFFALGLVLFRVFKHRFTAAAIGMNVAVIDEYIQIMIPGREGRLEDVLIDCVGVLLAVCLFSRRKYEN